MRSLTIHFSTALMMANVNFSFILTDPNKIFFFFKICFILISTRFPYCFPSPSLQFGQVHATRRRRGLAGLELLAAGAEESEVITTSIVPSAGVGDASCPLEVVGADATVTNCVACGVPVVTTCHFVGSLGSC